MIPVLGKRQVGAECYLVEAQSAGTIPPRNTEILELKSGC